MHLLTQYIEKADSFVIFYVQFIRFDDMVGRGSTYSLWPLSWFVMCIEHTI